MPTERGVESLRPEDIKRTSVVSLYQYGLARPDDGTASPLREDIWHNGGDEGSRGTRVYFLSFPATKSIKIGFSRNVEKRINSLREVIRFPLILLGTVSGGWRKEQQLHAKFSPLRMEGKWFKDTPELRDFIEAVREEPDFTLEDWEQGRLPRVAAINADS